MSYRGNTYLLSWWMFFNYQLTGSLCIQPSVVQIPSSLDPQGRHNISISGDQFIFDGKPLHIVSGSVHYFRLPHEYWRDRLYKLKAAGLNTVDTYVEWSTHEKEERQYSFEEGGDVAKFIRMAAEEGLHVLLRPGPYICAERDLGGLPYWLLSKYPHIRLRSTDRDFIHETRIWMAKLFEKLSPLLSGNGGPIILVQVENEYGSYGSDTAYMEQIRDIIKEHVGNKALLYTTDGPYTSMIRAGAVSGALTTIDFGVSNDVRTVFGPLRRFMPMGPLMNSEYYPGWLTHWGESIQRVDKDKVVKGLKDMLDNNVNLNFYMFYGGTNFEFSAGANYFSFYQPDITSYDYDAPLSEAGDPTPKYDAIREAMKQYYPELGNIPAPLPSTKGAYGKILVVPELNLLSSLGRMKVGKRYSDVKGTALPTFEKLRQRAGLLLYETTVNDTNSVLQIKRPHDRVYVYTDGVLQGVLNRMDRKYTLDLKSHPGSILSLLVETQGRINYGKRIHDFKGILSTVMFNSVALSGPWTVIGYPLDGCDTTTTEPNPPGTNKGPVFYSAEFTLPTGQTSLDTFIDTSNWGKGYIWINGYNLGRYWPSKGPQVTLFVPGVWLKTAPAANTLRILELESAPDPLEITLIDHPIFT